jgi:hypothetical protein
MDLAEEKTLSPTIEHRPIFTEEKFNFEPAPKMTSSRTESPSLNQERNLISSTVPIPTTETKVSESALVKPSEHQFAADDINQGTPKKSLSRRFTFNADSQSVGDMCHICQKRVYPTERISANERIFHKTCFRCKKCNGVLNVRNFTFLNDEIMCKPHYIEKFKVAGRYNDPVPSSNTASIQASLKASA